ncbi:MAG: NusG domain II-containing protein [Clostridia bacterium]|nr:NusG domain II-containing protein [Clostridia bacterium]
MFKKADIILAVVLIVLGLAASYLISFGDELGSELKISSQGSLFGTYSLLEDQTIKVKTDDGHFNRVQIRDGQVSVDAADCTGQDCVHSHAISKGGETIVCLPNKLVLEITGGEKAYDSVSR